MAKQFNKERSNSGGPKKRSFAPRKDNNSGTSRPFRKDDSGEERKRPSRYEKSSDRSEGRERPARRESRDEDKRPSRKTPFRKDSYSDKKEFKRDSDREEGGSGAYERSEKRSSSRPFRKDDSGKERRPSGKTPFRKDSYGDKKEFKRDSDREEGGSGAYERSEKRSSSRPFSKDNDTNRKGGFKTGLDEKKPFARRDKENDFERNNEDKRNYRPVKRRDDEASTRPRHKDRPSRGDSSERPEKRRAPKSFDRPERKPFLKRDGDDFEGGEERTRKPFSRPFKKRDDVRKPYDRDKKPSREKGPTEKKKSSGGVPGEMRLNKYIANSGICSRREADELIKAGTVSVNGKIITEMGYKITPSDIINYGGQTLRRERMVYVLLNKPKDYITTAEDPEGRKTVLHLIRDACKERIYPVGRLDRNTTGVLLFTNDGELTKKLTHPKHGVKKIYHVELDKPLKQTDFNNILEGVELEDGIIKADDLSYVGEGADKKQVGIEIHSGKNRIIRRLFEHLGYEVHKLDRVTFAGLTKKDLSRGRWRFLSQEEVSLLKMIK